MDARGVFEEGGERRSQELRRFAFHFEAVGWAPCAGGAAVGGGGTEAPVPGAGFQRAVRIVHAPLLRCGSKGFAAVEAFRTGKGELQLLARLHGLRHNEGSRVQKQFIVCFGVRPGAYLVLIGIGGFYRRFGCG